jgi:hypothetical protein
MPTVATPSPQLDLFMRDTAAYQEALARYEVLRPILPGDTHSHAAQPSDGHPLWAPLA